MFHSRVLVSIVPAGIKENQPHLPNLTISLDGVVLPSPSRSRLVAALHVTEEHTPFLSLGGGRSVLQCSDADAVASSGGYRGCDGDNVHCLYPA